MLELIGLIVVLWFLWEKIIGAWDAFAPPAQPNGTAGGRPPGARRRVAAASVHARLLWPTL